jgi:hypothetical protein
MNANPNYTAPTAAQVSAGETSLPRPPTPCSSATPPPPVTGASFPPGAPVTWLSAAWGWWRGGGSAIIFRAGRAAAGVSRVK